MKRNAKSDRPIQFPEWLEVLAHSELPERQKELGRITVRWYLSFCRRGQVIR